MKSYSFKSGVLLLLVLPVALLQAGGSKPTVLSLEGSGIYSEYVKLTNKVVAEPPWLATLMEKSGVNLAAVQDLVLLLEQPGAMDKEMAPWQKQFVLLEQKQDEQVNAAYQSLRDRADALPDANEKTYLQGLIDYAIFNTKQGMLPDTDTIKQTLVDLRARLKPVVSGNKYQLSDLYRLYAEVLSRLISLLPAEMMSLSNDAKRFAQQATEFDKNNGAAYLTLGSWYAYAPKAAGGDDNYALKLFKQARDLRVNNLDLLMSWNMSAIAYDQLKQPDMVRQSIEQALGILPIFQVSLEYRRKIDSNKPLEEVYFE